MLKKPTTRLELLQGTLDMLVLRALLFGPRGGVFDRQRRRASGCRVRAEPAV
jgi:hypothetical protein